MCGRYVRRGDKQKIAEWFHAEANPAELAMPDADFNVAPTTHQPIIRQSRETGKREIVLARWGFGGACQQSGMRDREKPKRFLPRHNSR
jgi:putative SOS response-associated peptidase YedK